MHDSFPTMPFDIDHLDPLGQGVSKNGEQVCFIPKTLPGENGTMRVAKTKSKKLFWGQVQDLKTSSKKRIKAVCPHYNECNGCHYLHTDYENELFFKKQTLLWIFKKNLTAYFDIEVIGAKKRTGYRNRIQFHYDKINKKVGFINPFDKSITNTPECKVVNPIIENKLRSDYDNIIATILGNRHMPQKGHIELYEKDGEIYIAENSTYAHLGFSQVNPEMNNLLVDAVTNEVLSHCKFLNLDKNSDDNSLPIIDLFGGSGNLSSRLDNTSICVVDSTPVKKLQNKNQLYIRANLNKEKDWINLTKKLKSFTAGRDSIVILDPPRAGCKFLSQYIRQLSASLIIYVSCNPQTLKRDLDTLSTDYKLQKIYLIDLFPGTYHFETVVTLRPI